MICALILHYRSYKINLAGKGIMIGRVWLNNLVFAVDVELIAKKGGFGKND